MKPEDLVPSRSTCIALKEAGFPQDTFFCWGDEYDEPRIYRTDGCCGDWINPDDILAAAPTLGEILEQFSDGYAVEKWSEKTSCCIGLPSGKVQQVLGQFSNPAEAAARLWIKVVGKEEGREG